MSRLHPRFWLIMVLLCIALVVSIMVIGGKRQATLAQERWNSLYVSGKQYMKQGRYHEAEQAFSAALDMAEQSADRNYQIGKSLEDLACSKFSQGKYPEAERLYGRAIEYCESRIGSDSLSLARNLNALGNVYSEQKKDSEAKPLYERALEIRQKRLKPDDDLVAESLNNLGALYTRQGKFQEAESFLNRSLAIREKSLGKKSIDYANTLSNLAYLRLRQGKVNEAESLYKQVLDIRKKILGTQNPLIATDLGNLADLYYGEKRYKEAGQSYSEAIAIMDNSSSNNYHYLAIYTLSNAFCHLVEGDYEKAQTLFERSLSIRQKAYGEDSKQVVHAMKNYAKGLKEMGRSVEAAKLLARVESPGAHSQQIDKRQSDER